MTPEEVGHLVVRLAGDASSFQAMLSQAQVGATQTAQSVGNSARQIEGFGGRLNNFAVLAMKALGALGVAATLKGAFDSFAEAEVGAIRLRAAIESAGGAAEPLVARYTQVAEAIAAVSLNTKGSILALFRQAETMQLSGDAAEQAVRMAVALAEATDREASGMLSVAAAMQRGDFDYAKRILRLKDVKDAHDLERQVTARMASGWAQAQAIANSASGRMERLGRSLKSLSTELGGMIATAVLPVVDAVQRAVDWFKSLDPVIRKVTAASVGLASAWLAMPTTLALLTPVLTTIAGMIGTVFTPAGVAIGAVIAIVGTLVERLGGIDLAWTTIKTAAGSAWDYVKERTSDFMTWVRPVTNALSGFFTAAWDRVREGVVWVWDASRVVFTTLRDYVLSVWAAIFGSTTINWNGIRDTIVESVLMAEFSLRNMGQVAEFVWTSMKLGFVQFANQFEYFFTTVIPTTLTWFRENWRDIFTDVWNWTKTVFMNLGENIVSVFSNVPGLIAGTTRWDEVWKPLTEGFLRQSQQLVLPERVIGALEAQFAQEFNQQGDALGRSFAEFRQQRLAAITDVAQEAQRQTDDMARLNPLSPVLNTAKEVNKEIGKWDAALVGSAEAISRMEAYRDMMADRGPSRASQATSTTATPPAIASEVARPFVPAVPTVPATTTPAQAPTTTSAASAGSMLSAMAQLPGLISQAVGQAVAGITSVVAAVPGAFGQAVSGVVSSVAGIPDQVGQAVLQTLATFVMAITQAGTQVASQIATIPNVIAQIPEAISQALGSIPEFGGEVVAAVSLAVGAMSGAMAQAVEAITAITNDVGQAFAQVAAHFTVMAGEAVSKVANTGDASGVNAAPVALAASPAVIAGEDASSQKSTIGGGSHQVLADLLRSIDGRLATLVDKEPIEIGTASL